MLAGMLVFFFAIAFQPRRLFFIFEVAFMPVVRRETISPYFSCSRSLAQNDSLSLEAVGLMAYLLSKPDTWEAQFSDIEARGKFGRDSRRRLFAELECAGYFERKRERRPDGTWDYALIVHEDPLPVEARTALSKKADKSNKTPSPENPSTVQPSPEKPSTAEPSTVNQAIIDNREVHNRERDNKEVTEEGAALPPVQPAIDSKHPAIVFFRKLTNRYPDKTLFAKVAETLGEIPNQQLAEECYSTWVARGWNKMNLSWLFDWYAKGGVAAQHVAKGNPVAGKSNGLIDATKLSPKTRGNAQALEDFLNDRGQHHERI